jgi:hypothetical protein
MQKSVSRGEWNYGHAVMPIATLIPLKLNPEFFELKRYV